MGYFVMRNPCLCKKVFVIVLDAVDTVHYHVELVACAEDAQSKLG